MPRILSRVAAAAWMLAGAASTQENLVIQSSAREVLLEIGVHDQRGRLVMNLQPGDLAVYEDGVKQEIQSFRLVRGNDVRREDEKTPPESASAPPEASRVNPLNPLRTVNAICLILSDLNQDTRAFAFNIAKNFLNHELRPNTFIGVFTLDSTGLRPVIPFSNNRASLLEAVRAAAINQLPPSQATSMALLNGLSIMTGGTISIPSGADGFADGASALDPLGTRGDIGAAVQVGLREIGALSGLVKQLGYLPFQKTVLLVGPGLTRPPDQPEYWQALIHLANQDGVTFYGVDPYGLGVCQDSPTDCLTSSSTVDSSVAFLNKAAGLSQGQAGSGLTPAPLVAGGQVQGGSVAGPSPTAQVMEAMHQSDYLRFGVESANTQAALRELSENTGGFLIANTNNTGALLGRVMDQVETHYEVSYRPKSDRNDGHFRQIEVKLSRPDLRVETRQGYFAIPETGNGPLTGPQLAGLRALDSKPLPNAFAFESRAYRFRPQAGGAQYAIAFEVPIASLTATPEKGENRRRFHASLLALVRNAQGDVVSVINQDVPSEVSDERLPALLRERMSFERAVSLAPGHYTVDAAVVDEEGSRASARSFEIDCRPSDGPEISDLALVRRVDALSRPPDDSDPFEIPGKRALPAISAILPEGEKPFIYFVAYPEANNSSAPVLEARFLKAGRVIGQKKSELPALDANGAAPMAIAALPEPGDYEVSVTLTQGAKTAERTLKYSIVPHRD